MRAAVLVLAASSSTQKICGHMSNKRTPNDGAILPIFTSYPVGWQAEFLLTKTLQNSRNVTFFSGHAPPCLSSSVGRGGGLSVLVVGWLTAAAGCGCLVSACSLPCGGGHRLPRVQCVAQVIANRQDDGAALCGEGGASSRAR